MLACPSCRIPLGARGALRECESCGVAVPAIDGFARIAEAFPASDRARLERLEVEAARELTSMRRFVDDKWQRPAWDAYALFQPFNEATRALLPLLSVLREVVRPGGRILDTWCRTGWTGELLAGLFPEQRVISLWEGDTNVLGVRGFRRFLPEGRRAPNLEIVFAAPGSPWPFLDASFDLVVGTDSLHRYPILPFLSECLRVARRDGVVVFPHVHLANGEPEPFFQRGGHIHHGRAWAEHFARRLQGDRRKAYLVSEAALFEAEGPFVLEDDPDMAHYNALVLVADRALAGRAIPPLLRRTGAERVVVNPLFAIDLDRGRAAISRERLGGAVGHLLERHPIYERRMRPGPLDRLERLTLFWAERGLTIDELAAKLGPEARSAVERLEARELVRVERVSAAMHRLQRFYGAQDERGARPPEPFGALWAEARERYGERPVLVSDDGSAFSFADVEQVVGAMRAMLAARGVGRGERVAVVAGNRPEVLLLTWAALLEGIAVVAIDPKSTRELVESALARTEPRLVFADARGLAAAPEAVALDALELGPYLELPPRAEVSAPDAVGAILFTSGSSGLPKAVVHAQAALVASGRAFAEATALSTADRFMTLGAAASMSGLRNPCFAALAAGATIAVADAGAIEHGVALAESARSLGVTLLSLVPAALERLLDAHARGSELPRLRAVLSTGSALRKTTLERAEAAFGAPCRNYYGLTESCGLTIAAPIDEPPGEDGDIGRPIGTLAVILGEDGGELGDEEVGELVQYGDRFMRGYLGDPEASARLIRDGWLYTGDLARRTADGRIVLCGRRDDRFKDRNGSVVYPAEIERALCGEPGVREAFALATVRPGSSDPRIFAFVVGEGAGLEERLRRRALELLGRARAPDRIVLKEQLPRTPAGKVNKDALLGEVRDVE